MKYSQSSIKNYIFLILVKILKKLKHIKGFSRVIKLLSYVFKYPKFNTIDIDNIGIQLKMSIDTSDSIQREILFEHYDSFWLAYIINLLKLKESCIFDVGANCGIYSISCSKLNPLNKIYAFEPVKENIAVLISNIKLNNLKNCEIIPLVLSNTTGLVGFLKTSQIGESGWGGIAPETNQSKKEFYDSTTVDNFCDSRNIRIIDLLKIDVEGAELFVLKGAENMIKNGNVKTILFEINVQRANELGISYMDIFSLLESHNYDIINKEISFNKMKKDGVANFIAIRDALD